MVTKPTEIQDAEVAAPKPTAVDAHGIPSNDLLPKQSRRRSRAARRPVRRWESSEYGVLPYLNVLFAHKYLIAFLTLLSALVAWGAVLVWPRSYESQAKLLIRAGHESVSLDPTATTSQTLAMEKSQEADINTALDILSSRHLAEKVVEIIGTQPIMSGRLPKESSGDTPPVAEVTSSFESATDWAKDQLHELLLASGIRDDLSDHELAIRRVQSSLTISAPKQSSVVSILAHAADPLLAQTIARTLTEEYLTQNLFASHTLGSLDFFHDEVEAAKAHLAELQTQRTEFLKKHDVVSIEANLSILTEQLSTLEREGMEAQSNLDRALAEREDLLSRIATTDDEVVASKELVFDETWSGMRQSLYALEIQEKSLEAKYSDDYPPLQEVRKQLSGVREILKDMQSERVNESTILNPVKQQLESDLQSLETTVIGLQTLISKKQSDRLELSQRVHDLHDLSQQLSVMDREIDSTERNLALLRSKLDEAVIMDNLQQKRISSVNVVQPATFVERAASPNKKLLFAAICLLGLIGSSGFRAGP